MTTTAAAHTALSSCLNHDPNKWVVRGSVLTTENEDALTICRTICPRREACLQEILERGPKCRPVGMIEGGVWWDQHGNPAVWTPTPKEEPVNTHQYLSELRKLREEIRQLDLARKRLRPERLHAANRRDELIRRAHREAHIPVHELAEAVGKTTSSIYRALRNQPRQQGPAVVGEFV